MTSRTHQRGYLGMRPDDLEDKPYARHWNPQMAGLPARVQHALDTGPEAGPLGFPFSEIGQLLEPGYLPMEDGYTRLHNGQVFVATRTEMPGTTPEMIDWWFGWHYMESERYKLWHPRAHVANGAERMIGDEPGLTDREKYLHNPNYVTEFIGADLLKIVIAFHPPEEIVDTSRFAEAGIGTMVCGTVSHPALPITLSRLVHQVRTTAAGCEMRSRFWLGELQLAGAARLLEPLVRSRPVLRRAVSLEQGRELLVHCAAEMNHLASFLPALFADYH